MCRRTIRPTGHALMARGGNHISIGPVTIRVGSKCLAPWGFPRLRIGGMSFWDWTNGGHFMPVACHPRGSITWTWFAVLSRRDAYRFSDRWMGVTARLFVTGNPYAFRVRWWHRFVQFDRVRRGQWSDYYRLPFGFVLTITHQARMDRRK